MKVTIQGQGDVTLTQREFVAAGGEGEVYAKGTTAFKVYTDPSRALSVGKITELASIRDPNVIKPERMLLDPKKGTPVGYTMRYVQDTMALCGIFTRAFREREGLDHPKMLHLVLALQGLIEHVHQAGVLIVDLNELNFLVDRGLSTVYAIDVDSYQTRSYPATAIMPSVRDWSVKNQDWTEVSDWFSFACVAFQMFTGIHPFRGKHPTVCGLEDRMQAGISVFDPSVSIPKVVYPQDVIPTGYRSWLKAVLQGGQRLPPPSDPLQVTPIIIPLRVVLGGAALEIIEVSAFTAAILGYVDFGGHTITATEDGVYLGPRRVRDRTAVRAVGFTPKMNRGILAWIEKGTLRLFDTTSKSDIPCVLHADDVMGHGGRIYVRNGEQILEMVLSDVGERVIATTRVAVNVVEHATRMHDGVVVQNLLGSTFVSVFPQAEMSYQIRVKELVGLKVIDARYDGRVLMAIVATASGTYDRLTFVFSADHASYTLRAPVRDVTPAGLNFIVLDNGIIVHLNEDEDLEVSAITSDKVRLLKDPALGNDMRLVRHGGRVAFVRGNKVFSMRMR